MSLTQSRVTSPLVMVDTSNGDVIFCESVQELLSAVEGIDIAEGSYLAYDSVGRAIELEPHGHRRGRFAIDVGLVRAKGVESEPTHADELKMHLLRWARVLGREIRNDASLADTIQACRQK